MTTEARLRVRYAETDQMGVVYYSNYLVWMEVGRIEFCRAVGFNYRDMEAADGVLLAVIEAECRYIHPARYDDEILIQTRVEGASPRGVCFSYQIRRACDQRLLATGATKHIFCGRDMKPTRLPRKYFNHFGM